MLNYLEKAAKVKRLEENLVKLDEFTRIFRRFGYPNRMDFSQIYEDNHEFFKLSDIAEGFNCSEKDLLFFICNKIKFEALKGDYLCLTYKNFMLRTKRKDHIVIFRGAEISIEMFFFLVMLKIKGALNV